jgi:hypothetical protein
LGKGWFGNMYKFNFLNSEFRILNSELCHQVDETLKVNTKNPLFALSFPPFFYLLSFIFYLFFHLTFIRKFVYYIIPFLRILMIPTYGITEEAGLLRGEAGSSFGRQNQHILRTSHPQPGC